MNLNISGHHMDLTDALRDYVNAKLARVERHFDHVIEAEVVLEVEKERHKAEATLKLSGTTLHAEATETDMYAAIDLMADKLDRQTRKFKEKITDHHNREAQRLQTGAV
ncbi:ribosome-associated translation inhibitor RaiA [Salinisphaera sp. P385]|uniref:Ribosome hibernation promoting factor n=1 Tax=Spectribacter acetivorans TaxID=3075603 RepID=A0ABU3B6N0_9GAMM|nr:ribosome-associated translation inhibitor RaiA [Salinisphaera sp. P385]MDT0618112.1 ribosome-associated translation inhibitor RaiA [Salinisphaera sp. P385]